ncbi:sugar ABC transporter ATP-binding protein [Patulibacter defluvii]|uniref:sugar ABC transporter ATP-binding protein n=1 Tax=Patulibacter defluvii TaxID=3095358 RepID=UPI002A75EB46|nr:sugar ABC transporter ATP-binding protein [Patulibacter sp. DM4]
MSPATAPADPAGAATTAAAPIVALRGIAKTYGAIRALRGVDLEIRPGEVHALLGENGAGKSTLVKCLAGAVIADEGEFLVDGAPVTIGGPSDALDVGVRVVYQELALFPTLSVAENVVGRELHDRRRVDWRALRAAARDHLAAVELDVDVDARVEQLSVGSQQMVEVARALGSGGRVIVLDEPTSALGQEEIEQLFRSIRRLADQGVSFLLVTHFLEDVIAHADRATVIRDGQRVATVDVARTTKDELVGHVVGDAGRALRAGLAGQELRLPPRPDGEVLVRASDVRRPPAVREMSLDVRAGEVVGIYGDLASGHAAFAEMLFGLAAPEEGELEVLGHAADGSGTRRARERGVGFVPGDRRAALALEQPIFKNMTLATLPRRGPLLREGAERRTAAGLIERLRVANGTPDLPAGALSGGNQQKVVLARWMIDPPRLMVLVEPTRGMDVGAKAEVVDIVRSLAADGRAAVVVSSEPEIVLDCATRVLVAKRGRIVAAFSDRTLTKDQLMREAF